MFYDLHEPTYSVSETAKIIGVDRSTIYRLIRDKQIETTYDSPIRIKLNKIKIYMLTKAPKASVLWANNNHQTEPSMIWWCPFPWESGKEINYSKQ